MANKINLQLFDEGASAGATDGANAAEGVEASPNATESVEQSSPATEETDRKEQYAKFKADYKAEYDAEVQSIVKDRLKKANQQKAESDKKLKSLSPILSKMASKYGVDVNDVDALMHAYDNDDANYEDEAYEKGMTVEQVKQFHQIEKENATLKEAEEKRRQQEVFADWDRQAEALKQVYSDFDLMTEMQDDNFRKMMNSGVPIRTAYEVAHHDEIMQGAMQFAAKKSTEKVTNAVISNSARPSENGLSNTAPVTLKTDISSLSREQMADYKRRAMAGEIIDFRNK